MSVALVVDDESSSRRQVSEILRGYGFDEVLETASTTDALTLVQTRRPNLVVMEANLHGGHDGIRCAEKMGSRRPVPIVLFTAEANGPSLEEARKAGVMNYVLKPLNPHQLHAAIDLALYQFSEMDRLREEVTTLRKTLETRKLVDRAKAVLMARGMSEPVAYRKIQQTAMDKRKSLKEVAEAILLVEG